MTRVSVIIPVKNGRANMERLLDSLAGLHHPAEDLEILVCDNGSTDGTQAICRSRGHTVLDLPGLSIAGLRNTGAAQATGEVLAFVDSDCSVEPDWLEVALAELDRPGVLATGCYPAPPPDATWVQRLWTLKPRLPAPGEVVGWLPSMNLLLRRQTFVEVGGFDVRLKTCEDVDLCYRLRDLGGSLTSHPGIGATHFGEPPDLRTLFRKERWHGQDNLRGFIRHGARREEVSSVLVPILTAGCYLAPFLVIFPGVRRRPLLLIMAASAPLLPPALAFTAAVRLARAAHRPDAIPGLTLLYWTWLLARAAAFIDELPALWKDRGRLSDP